MNMLIGGILILVEIIRVIFERLFVMLCQVLLVVSWREVIILIIELGGQHRL